MQFGATVRRLRKQLGLTQEALAVRANLDRAHLATVESGVRNIALTGIARIATALDLNLAGLYRQTERGPSRGVVTRRSARHP